MGKLDDVREKIQICAEGKDMVTGLRKIKIQFAGWWDTFQPDTYIITQLLKRHYDVVISDEPDYVFCSLYSKEFLKYDCVRIFYTAENVTPDFNLFDYCIGFDELSFGDRYIRVPNYGMNPKYQRDIQLLKMRHTNIDKSNSGRKFCASVVSNGNADPMRDRILDEISGYKQVDSGGKYRNNIGMPNGVPDKLEFQKNYKFALAIENISFTGYTTEKLVEAFAAGGIPIYWGDPDVGRYFNEKAFINIMSYPSLEAAIGEIKRADKDAEVYQAYLSEPAMLSENHFEQLQADLEDFLCHIIEQPLEIAKRRPISVWAEDIARMAGGVLIKEQERVGLINRLKGMMKR